MTSADVSRVPRLRIDGASSGHIGSGQAEDSDLFGRQVAKFHFGDHPFELQPTPLEVPLDETGKAAFLRLSCRLDKIPSDGWSGTNTWHRRMFDVPRRAIAAGNVTLVPFCRVYHHRNSLKGKQCQSVTRTAAASPSVV